MIANIPASNAADPTELGTEGLKPSGGVDLEVQNLAVRFGGNAALVDVDLRIEPGEVVGIVGPNGAGKTTLLNAISGVLGTSHLGRVLVDGQDVSTWAPARLARAGIARSFQDPRLLESLSVTENIMCGGHLGLRYRTYDQIFRPRMVARAEYGAHERVREIMQLTGLGSLGSSLASSLPYGKRKLVDIARALFMAPRLLLLDEPTSGLDRGEQENIQEILFRLHGTEPMTIILVEHHMEVVRAICGRVVGMQGGTVLLTGSPKEVLDSTAFREAIVGTGRQ